MGNAKVDEKMIPLRSLVTEITGTDKDSLDFDANYKQLQRLVKDARGLEGVEGDGTKILESKRVKFVSAMKELLKSDEYYQVFKKMKTGTENMTRDEMLLFVSYHIRFATEGQDEEVKKIYEEIFETMTEAKYFAKLQTIFDQLEVDSEIFENIHNHEAKFEYMDRYLKTINEQLEPLRQEMNLFIVVEREGEKLMRKMASQLDRKIVVSEEKDPLLYATLLLENIRNQWYGNS